MHILWLVRTTLPQAAAACGLAGASDVSGSWLTGQLAALRACPDLQLTVLCVGKADADGTADGVHYRVVRDTAAFAPLLQAGAFDLVHIWGTEYDAAAVMADAARAQNLPVLFSIQGVMRDCAAHLCDGVPDAYRHSGAVWHAIDRAVPGELLDNMQANFDALASKEAALLHDARHVTGRTGFDRAACAALAPSARYYPCNETLRPLFYTGTLWHAREFAAAPVLFLPQGNYPLKNLHTVIKALPAVLAQYGNAQLQIAGWPPLDKGPLLRPVMDNLANLFGGDAGEQERRSRISYLFDAGVLTAEAMNFMRGRSITDTWLIIDEAQNLTPRQVKGIITRVGKGTKVVLLGDPAQIDHPLLDTRSNGLTYASARMKGSPLCVQLTMLPDECERSSLALDAAMRM